MEILAAAAIPSGFIEKHPDVIAWILAILLGVIGFLVKRALDNNTDAMRDLKEFLETIDKRLQAVEAEQHLMKAVCVERHEHYHKMRMEKDEDMRKMARSAHCHIHPDELQQDL